MDLRVTDEQPREDAKAMLEVLDAHFPEDAVKAKAWRDPRVDYTKHAGERG